MAAELDRGLGYQTQVRKILWEQLYAARRRRVLNSKGGGRNRDPLFRIL